MSMIEMKDVVKKYDNGTTALRGVTVHIEPGEFAYIVGPSGAGKSTFIRLLYREVKHDKGSLKVAGLVGLKHKVRSFPNELSGGEQQRIAIARAIVNNPKVLIADEPTGNLDPDNSWEIMNLLERINLQGTTVLMATHNSQIVNTLRHRVIAIENGRVVRDEAEGEYGYDD